MQDIIIEEILQHSLLKTQGAKNLISTLFQINCELPEQVAKLRPSYLNFQQVMQWGGAPENAHAASLMAMNSDHGCFTDAFDFIDRYTNKEMIRGTIREIITNKFIIPGFGNPVIKNYDPRCVILQKAFAENVPDAAYLEIINMIEVIQEEFKSVKNLPIYPNLVFWNAAIIYVLGLPRQFASLVFILATQITYLNKTLK